MFRGQRRECGIDEVETRKAMTTTALTHQNRQLRLVVCDGSGAIMLLCAVAAMEGDDDALGVVYCSGGRR